MLLDVCRYHVLRDRIDTGDRLYRGRPWSTMWRSQRGALLDEVASCITRIVTDHTGRR
jgi:hypothetical protein